MSNQNRPDSGRDSGNVTVPSKLRNEPAAWFEGLCNAAYHSLGIGYPMQCSIGKDRVELLLKWEILGTGHLGGDSILLSRCDHIGRVVNAQDIRSSFGNLDSKYSVPTTDIEDALARLRIEPVQEKR